MGGGGSAAVVEHLHGRLSLGVNAHGRDPQFGPVIETVQSLRITNGAGEILNVRRVENSKLFSLVIDGYGPFGAVRSADIQLTEDDVYKKCCKRFDYRTYPAHIEANVGSRRDGGLHYARPSIRHSDLLRTTVACTFTKATGRPAGIFRLQQVTGVARNSAFFNLSRMSDTGKDLRWFLQNTFADNHSVNIISRNNAMKPELAFLQFGGIYYLPYQQYTTGVQVRKAYAQLDAFIQKKAVYDPNGVFR